MTRIRPAHGQGVLSFTPSLNRKRMLWKCSADYLDPKVLPPDCR